MAANRSGQEFIRGERVPSFDGAYSDAITQAIADLADAAEPHPPKRRFEARSDGTNQRFALIPAGSGNPPGFQFDAPGLRDGRLVARLSQGLVEKTLVLIEKGGWRFIVPRTDLDNPPRDVSILDGRAQGELLAENDLAGIPTRVVWLAPSVTPDVAICPTDPAGSRGNVNVQVLERMGHGRGVLESASQTLTESGFAALWSNEQPPAPSRLVLAVVSTHGKEKLRTNLANALAAHSDALVNRSLWVPLLGTGEGRISPADSLRLVIEVVHAASRSTDDPGLLTGGLYLSVVGKQAASLVAVANDTIGRLAKPAYAKPTSTPADDSGHEVAGRVARAPARSVAAGEADLTKATWKAVLTPSPDPTATPTIPSGLKALAMSALDLFHGVVQQSTTVEMAISACRQMRDSLSLVFVEFLQISLVAPSGDFLLHDHLDLPDRGNPARSEAWTPRRDEILRRQSGILSEWGDTSANAPGRDPWSRRNFGAFRYSPAHQVIVYVEAHWGTEIESSRPALEKTFAAIRAMARSSDHGSTADASPAPPPGDAGAGPPADSPAPAQLTVSTALRDYDVRPGDFDAIARAVGLSRVEQVSFTSWYLFRAMLALSRPDHPTDSATLFLKCLLQASRGNRSPEWVDDHAFGRVFPENKEMVAGLMAQRLTSADLQLDLAAWSVIRLAVTRGSELAHRSGGNLHTRHILAALLVTDDVRVALENLCIVDELLRSWATVLEANNPTEQWSSILGVAAVGSTPDIVRDGIARFASDTIGGSDHLGVEREARVLARYLAARELAPPIAVGVFGEWGSGKSFFLERLRTSIDELAKLAREMPGPVPYCGQIAQIEFNAWHYGEGNLWASLVAHLFERLRLPDSPASSEKRAELLTAIYEASGGVQAAEGRVSEARMTKEAAESALALAERTAEAMRGQLTAARVIRTVRDVLNTPAVKEQTEHVVSELRRAGFEEVNDTLGAVQTVQQRRYRLLAALRAVWADLRDPKTRTAVLGTLSLTFLFSSILTLIVHSLPHGLSDFRWVAGCVGAVSSFAVFSSGLLARADGLLATLQEIIAAARTESQRPSPELESLKKRLDEAAGEEEARRKELADASADLANAKAALAALHPDRQLRDFIAGRDASEDYRKSLGTLALVRRDFQRLADLLAERKASADSGDRGDTPTYGIDRVILYIDDLDRCNPDKVVDVLQAIHLLLAFPVFVVVVGVDPRWVSKALRTQYDWLSETGAAGHLATGSATTSDYLEKIFQIPFWLEPLRSSTQVALVRGLTAPSPQRTTRADPAVAADFVGTSQPMDPSVSEAASIGNDHGSETTTSRATGAMPAGGAYPERASNSRPTPPELDVDLLELSAADREQIERLAAVYARSPRSMKRYVNCYRLLRALLPATEAASFFTAAEGDTSLGVAVAELLAVVVGDAALGAEVLEAIVRGRLDKRKTLLSSLKLPTGVSASGAWKLLRDRLAAAGAMQCSASEPRVYQRAAELVIRFAFRASDGDRSGRRGRTVSGRR